jgi:hypothetical protein
VALRISVFESKELQAARLALGTLDREWRKEVRNRLKPMVDPVWREAVRANTQSRQDVVVLSDTARVAVSDQTVTLKSAGVGRSLSGGARPSELARAVEFGSVHHRNLPARNVKGRVVYPAAARVIPRIVSLMVQTIIRTTYEAFEGK